MIKEFLDVFIPSLYIESVGCICLWGHIFRTSV